MIVIPMAGLSRRFTEAGYDLPKYMLPLHGKSVFAHSVASFANYFESQKFLFIARDVAETHAFINRECAALGIVDFTVCILNTETAGQAETVEIGLFQAGVASQEAITIFNIDTFRRDFLYPVEEWFSNSKGYLEVFRGEGANWSYVEPSTDASAPLVRRTTEKIPVSDLCCDGLYHFARQDDFLYALNKERMAPSMPELYVAPLYNHLISRGSSVHYVIVPEGDIEFCGVPSEYMKLLGTKPFA